MKVRLWLQRGAAALVLGAGLNFSAASQAQTYDLVGDFGSSAFAYGSGTNGSIFSAFTNTTFNCFGAAGVTCDNNSNNGYPFVAKNNSGSSVTYFNTNSLSFQSNSGGAGTDALIRFTAPSTGTYTISGFSSAEDPSGGQGQSISIFSSVGGISTSLYSTTVTGGYQVSNPFSNLTALLGAGDTITFGTGNGNGDNRFKTSGIEATIQLLPTVVGAVPEPASWAMMIVGFGLIGAGIRYRQRRTVLRYI